MKVTLNENSIRKMVSESLKSILNEIANMGMWPYEEKDSDNEKEHKHKHNKKGKSDMSQETGSESEKRNQVEDFFDQEGVNNAPYAYELFDVEPEKGKDTNDMKNARSQFEKDLHHEKNQSGYPYSFTSSEINQLQSMISSNDLNEAVQKAIKKVLK